MVSTLDRMYLKGLLDGKNHDTGKVRDVLPFASNKSPKIMFTKFIGDYVRMISGVQLDKKIIQNNDFYMSKENNDLSEFIAKDMEFNNEDDRFDFIRFLDEYLVNDNELKPIHPYLFNYIQTDKNIKNESNKFSHFMNTVLVKKDPDIKAIFTNKQAEDILTELILTKMESLTSTKPDEQDKKKNQYQQFLEPFTNLYKEDLIYLSKHQDYFIESFPVISHFYVFMYACQLLLKFDRFSDADMNTVQPLYFGLDWEIMNKRRKAAGDHEGFKYIKAKSANLFPHIHTISHLSHNVFNEERNAMEEKFKFIPYSELYKMIKSEGEAFENDFLSELKLWISEYSQIKKVKVTDDSEDIPQAFQVLFACLKEGMSTSVCEKYGKNIEALGAKTFIKSRGSLGQIFNIKHDFLLLLTAVCVKEKRIPLNELFKEYEKRGITFDRYSKKEIISILDNHNILDKKSDSGDAQYVKPIL